VQRDWRLSYRAWPPAATNVSAKNCENRAVSRLSRAWNRLPQALSWLLLAAQALIPWTAGHYVTEDGPSHLYNALVLKDVLLHPHGLYAAVYHFQARLVTNWSTPLLFGMLAPVFGTTHAEAALASLCVLVGFGCLTYFRRAIDPAAPASDPLTNFLLNTWFLWVGFYNFYLGMALCLLLAGFYLRHGAGLSRRQSVMLGAGLVGLFFTHVLPATLAAMAIVFLIARGPRPQGKAWLAALAPTAVLLGFFVRGGLGRAAFQPGIAWAWNSFPMQVFASAKGRTGGEELLVPAMLFLMTAGLLAVTREEWRSARIPLAAAALASFAGYLLLPDSSFGGGEIKARMAWAVFLFGSPVAASGTRVRALRTPVSVYITCFVAANLIFTAQLIRKISVAADVYALALEKIPEGSTLVKVQYGTQMARDRYGYDDIADDPLFHADSWMAARRRLIDLTDYQPLSRVFPITLRREFPGALQNSMRSLEDAALAGFEPLPKILADLPVRADYVVLVGDEGSDAVRRSDFAKTRVWLEANLEPVSATDFVRVYRSRSRR
jgi:hypothetical protein